MKREVADTDDVRSRRLLFARELADGTVRESDFARAQVRHATTSLRIPSRVSRMYQRALMKRGTLSYEQTTVPLLETARRTVLDAPAGPPRLLVRVDEFPHYLAADDPHHYGTEAFKRFHSIMTEAGMPYLIAVPPRVSTRPLDPAESAYRRFDDSELEQIGELRRDGVAFGTHGLDHRTRHARARRHSELIGLSDDELDERLALADAELAETAIRPQVFVPPFNRFAWRQWRVLARRYDVIGGGPESVVQMGYHHTPLWRGDAVWMPSYPPFYGTAAEVLPGARRLAEQEAALWVPVVLHWGWEADAEWKDLERFAREAAAWTASWDEFLEMVRISKSGSLTRA